MSWHELTVLSVSSASCNPHRHYYCRPRRLWWPRKSAAVIAGHRAGHGECYVIMLLLTSNLPLSKMHLLTGLCSLPSKFLAQQPTLYPSGHFSLLFLLFFIFFIFFYFFIFFSLYILCFCANLLVTHCSL